LFSTVALNNMALGVFAVAWLMVGLVVRRGGVSVRALLVVGAVWSMPLVIAPGNARILNSLVRPGHHNDDHLTDTGREPVVHQRAIKLVPRPETGQLASSLAEPRTTFWGERHPALSTDSSPRNIPQPSAVPAIQLHLVGSVPLFTRAITAGREERLQRHERVRGSLDHLQQCHPERQIIGGLTPGLTGTGSTVSQTIKTAKESRGARNRICW